MHQTKAPGPNGMPLFFYQRHWHIIGPSITKALLLALNSGIFPKDLNYTFITLIPKKKHPLTVADYLPISLYNVLYKLMSKAIANRLKAMVPSLIFESQSTFLPGHHITNNILVTYEVVNFLIMKTKGKQGFMSLMSNMNKAYDRVECDYLERTLSIFGFPNRFTNLIIHCVKSTSFSILINGTPKGPIMPSRRIRQGDPIFPYLFLLCTKGFVTMLKEAMVDKSHMGIPICRRAPTINHLLFCR